MSTSLPTLGDRVTLACSCDAEVVVRLIIFLPRHCVVRVVKRGSNCHALEHVEGRRMVVRWTNSGGHRIFSDVFRGS